MNFSFSDLSGNETKGQYRFNLGADFDEKLAPYFLTLDDFREHATPEVGFHPDVTLTRSAEGIVVNLSFRNVGEEVLAIPGPTAWKNSYSANGDFMSVAVSAAEGSGIGVYLSGDNLMGKEQVAGSSLLLKSGEAKILRFFIPFSAFAASDPIRRVRARTPIKLGGKMALHFLPPTSVIGLFEADLDFISTFVSDIEK